MDITVKQGLSIH